MQSRAGTPQSFSRTLSPGLPYTPAGTTPNLMEFGSSNYLAFPFNASPRPSMSGGLALPSYPSLPSRQSMGSNLSFDNISPRQPMARAPLGEMPSDSQIMQDVQGLIAVMDLNTVTKKTVRQQLASMYGLPDMFVPFAALMSL
jgi:hypothetical protein